jgi:hypothetical protein
VSFVVTCPAGEKLDLLVDKTDLLQGEAFAFRREATRARRVMWWKVRICGVLRFATHLIASD